ncbi:MAG: hypothetical protein HKN04_07870, partial [Rhodothermaceae bacterium]|nr:hypothetical protein [Rhodothermaceae bacterium]
MDSSRANRIAALGAVLSLPALLLFVSGMIQSATGAELMLLPDALLHPAVILGGLLVALVLNALVAVRLST